jgi:GxxExxY protein
VPVPIVCRDLPLEDGFRGDLIVEGRVLLQLKSVERVTPAREKQVQTYLRLTGLKPRYLLNFGEAVLRDGITRCVNRLEEDDLQRGGDAEIQTSPLP